MGITGKNVTYEELAPLLKTGDIVLFHGDSQFQEVIDALTGSPYNHMAMVVLSKDLGGPPSMAPIMLWESTPYAITEDQELHRPKAGPTLVDLETRINQEVERGMFFRFVFRQLSRPLQDANIRPLKGAIQHAYPDTFPTDKWFFIKGIIGRIFNREVRQPTFFCSELIAYTYQKMGLLSTQHPPDYYWPRDFSLKGHLPLRDNEMLGENLLLELQVKE
jgi:hypothetical protein